jgi:hypothetical protein
MKTSEIFLRLVFNLVFLALREQGVVSDVNGARKVIHLPKGEPYRKSGI